MHLLKKCHICGDKTLNSLKLQLDSQNDSNYLRWSSNPTDIKIFKKNTRQVLKKKSRTSRAVCLFCIMKFDLEQFVRKKDFQIIKMENERLARPISYLDYWEKVKVFPNNDTTGIPSKRLALEIPDQLVDGMFLDPIGFKNNIQEFFQKIKEQFKGLKLEPEMTKTKLKKVKMDSLVHPQRKSNEDLLSNLLSQIPEETNSESSKHQIIPQSKKLTLLKQKSHPNSPVSLGSNLLETPRQRSSTELKTTYNKSAKLEIASTRFKLSRKISKIKVACQGSLGKEHTHIHETFHNNLRNWRGLFSKEVRSPTTFPSVENQEGWVGRQSSQVRVPKGKAQVSGLGVSLMNETHDTLNNESLAEQLLKEEKKIGMILFNKSNKKVNYQSLYKRVSRILQPIEKEPPQEIDKNLDKISMLKENGHFNWDFLENQYFRQDLLNPKVLMDLDKKMIKKTFSEFLFLNESRLVKKKQRNFLVEFFTKKNKSNFIS